PTIQSTMKLARKKMDTYWKMTNDSNTYRIATGEHKSSVVWVVCADPRFWLQKWKDEWIEDAENLVREEYIDRYKDT
ncbi:uncharacterized protein BJ212DRAFT_1261220, partial [Suillus subaureus]